MLGCPRDSHLFMQTVSCLGLAKLEETNKPCSTSALSDMLKGEAVIVTC